MGSRGRCRDETADAESQLNWNESGELLTEKQYTTQRLNRIIRDSDD